MVNSIGKTGDTIRVAGKKENSMERESLSKLMEHY